MPESGFDTAKPVRLISACSRSPRNHYRTHLVLDFFAGSGTTGHAVMQQNAEDGGNRRFLTVRPPSPVRLGRSTPSPTSPGARLHAAAEQVSSMPGARPTGVSLSPHHIELCGLAAGTGPLRSIAQHAAHVARALEEALHRGAA